MYLDSNGDGVHTSSDQIHAVGPTVVDIWLDTNHNRDGTVAVCGASATQPLSMFGYILNLAASGGTVSYSTYANRVPQMGLGYPPHAPDATQFTTGAYWTPLGTSLPPGKYLLGTMTVSVVSGAPSIQIVAQVDWPYSDVTFFASQCEGTANPNSITLGIDWFDVDGLAYGTGGGPNQSPTLSPVLPMTVPVGENVTQTIMASDPEGQSLSFTKTSGPSFMSVATTDPGTGTARGEIRLAPFASDMGTASGAVSVTDGDALDHATFDITVSEAPNHPPHLPPAPRLAVVAGTVARRFLSAGDPDGGTITFTKVAGPAYVQVRELAARPGGSSASLTASPTLCDVGSALVSIAASDGMSLEERDLDLSIIPPSALPTSGAVRFAAPGDWGAIALGDLNGDGALDAVTSYQNLPMVSVFLGRGDGTVGAPVSYPIGTQSSALVVADLDRDGNLDVAAANTSAAEVSVLFGKGDGTLLPRIPYPTGNGPSGVMTADMNRDGILDLVTCNEQSATVSVLLGAGDGTFAAKRDAAAGMHPASLAVGDFNLDGRPDAAVANAAGGVGSGFTILPGLGDGSFGDALFVPFDGFPLSLLSGDWNWDGALDLSLTDFRDGGLATFFGHGDGTFAPPVKSAVFGWSFAGAAEDLNADGNTDLVVGNAEFEDTVVLLGDGAGGFGSPASVMELPDGPVAIGDLNSDGRPDLVVGSNFGIYIYLNRYNPTGTAEARAFVLGNRVAPSGSGGGDLRIRMEPVNGSYRNDQVVLRSLMLRSDGTGSVNEIHSVDVKNVLEADTDHNGIPEIAGCFAQADLAALFNLSSGRNSVSAHLSGSLTDGRIFCTNVEFDVLGTAGAQRASFAPNPLNPQSKLAFTTSREGSAKAQLFDLHGRLVRTLLDSPRLPAGRHEFSFDGRGDRGASLPSSVYFYRVECTEGLFAGQVVILR